MTQEKSKPAETGKPDAPGKSEQAPGQNKPKARPIVSDETVVPNPLRNPYAEGKGVESQDIKDYLAGEGEYADEGGTGFTPNSNMVGKQTLTHADQEPNAGDFDKDRDDEEAINIGEVILDPRNVDPRER